MSEPESISCEPFMLAVQRIYISITVTEYIISVADHMKPR